MAESRLRIVVGDIEILSELELFLAEADTRTVIRVSSSTSDHRQENTLTLAPKVEYSAEQMEYDIEVARHRFAEELARKIAVRQQLAGALRVMNPADIPIAKGGPRLARPSKKQ